MRKLSLQWRLTILTTVLITVLCGCLTFFLYKNGVYYIDTLQETVTDQGKTPEALYIEIPDNEWDNFASQFATEVYNSKSDYRNRSLLITGVVALLGGAVTYFISGRALKPLREFSETVEKVQAQNLTDYTIEENKIAELDILRTSYNKMLLRLSESFETQRQFTGNAAHELRTPLALIQAQLDLYHASENPENGEAAQETIQMVTEQNERLSKLVRTLLDMSELQTVARNDKIELCGLIEEVLADLEPLAQEKGVYSIGYNSDMSKNAPEACLCSVIWNWSAYYTSAVQSVIDGTWDGSNYYGGMNENLVGLTSLADFCADGTAEKVEEAKAAILSGENGVFDGVIETNTGETVGKEGKTLDDATITGGIDWYFKTVEVVE